MKKKKLKLKVPVSWTMEAMVEVEAYDLAEAVEVAKADFAQYGGEFLPEGKFVENSYHVEFEAIDVCQDEKTLGVMCEQEEMFSAQKSYDKLPEGYGIGGYIDSEGTVWAARRAYTNKQSKALAGKAFKGLVSRHRELVIGKDGAVEKLA